MVKERGLLQGQVVTVNLVGNVRVILCKEDRGKRFMVAFNDETLAKQ